MDDEVRLDEIGITAVDVTTAVLDAVSVVMLLI